MEAIQEQHWDHSAARDAATPTASDVDTLPPRVAMIDEMFGNAGGHPTVWRANLGHGGFAMDFEQARYEVNRCLRMLMVNDAENTWELRWSVVDTGSEGEWLDLLDMKVVPEMVNRGMVPRT